MKLFVCYQMFVNADKCCHIAVSSKWTCNYQKYISNITCQLWKYKAFMLVGEIL